MKKGFTLVEMIGVVAIMVILVLVALPNIMNSLNSAENMHSEAYVNALVTSAESYIGQRGSTLGERVTKLEPGQSYYFRVTDLVDYGYVQSTLTDEKNDSAVTEDMGCIKLTKNAVDTNIAIYKYEYVPSSNDYCSGRKTETELAGIYPTINSFTNKMVSSKAAIMNIEYTTNNVAGETLEISLDGGSTWTTKYTAEDVGSTATIKKIDITLTGLTHNTTYNVVAKVVLPNKNYDVSSIVSVTTKKISDPTYAVNTTGWAKQKTVTITYPEVENTELTYEYSKDRGSSWTATTTTTQAINFTSNGSLIARVSDGTNIVTASTYTVSQIDNVKPTITSITGNNNTTWVTNITLTVNATDDYSGIHEQGYSFDNGVTWQASNKYTVTTSGTYNIKVRDRAGNISDANQQVVTKVSNQTPTITIAKSGVGSNKIIVSSTVGNIESGTKKMEYSIDEGTTWVADGTNLTHTFNGLTTQATYNIKARVTANNGLTAISNTLSVTTASMSAPTYAINTTGCAKSKTVTITYPEISNTSLTRQYSTNGGSSWTTSSSNTQAVQFTSNGNIIARISDGTNTKTGSTYTVSNIDKTAPTITIAGCSSAGNCTKTIFKDSSFTAPNGTGADNCGITNTNATKSGTVNTAALGTYTVTYSVTDTAGNAGSAVLTVKVIDGTPTEYASCGSGNIGTYTVPADGYYKLEAYGAQGGYMQAGPNSSHDYTSRYGRGGYTSGTVYLTANTKLYITIGCKGGNSTTYTQAGSAGWNGGGTGGMGIDLRDNPNYNSTFVGGGGGGGATTITTTNRGEITNYASYTGDILIVAGGGGGGGGYSNNTTNINGNAGNGTTFGTGVNGQQNQNSAAGSGGGGGGYYGGTHAYPYTDASRYGHGQGGQGYVKAGMFDPVITASSHTGNGYAKITPVLAITNKTTYTYEYVGAPQMFTAPVAGKYKIEAYGAAGGIQSGGSRDLHGKGGYTTGTVTLSKGQSIYIQVGGKPTEASTWSRKGGGGWNGGANGGEGLDGREDDRYKSTFPSGGGGGGATSVTTTNRGTLSKFENYKGEIILVAGGGGGGGGYGRTSSYIDGNVAGAGGGSFGAGKSGNDDRESHAGSGGGGGGYAGGKTTSSEGYGGTGYCSSSLATGCSITTSSHDDNGKVIITYTN